MSAILLGGKILLNPPFLLYSSSDSKSIYQSSGESLFRQFWKLISDASLQFLAKYFLGSSFFIVPFLGAFLSKGYSPKRFKISQMRVVFSLESRGLDELKEGQTLHSISQGLSFSSIRISNPKSSKQLFLCSKTLQLLLSISGSQAMHAFIIVSSIFSKSSSVFIPNSSIFAL